MIKSETFSMAFFVMLKGLAFFIAVFLMI